VNGGRALQIFYIQPLQHARHGGGHLPDEKIIMEAICSIPMSLRPQRRHPMKTFFNSVKLLNLDVAQIAPVHGKPVPWSDFLKAMGHTTNVCFESGTTGGGVVMVSVRIPRSPERRPGVEQGSSRFLTPSRGKRLPTLFRL
jgi:hypothetical protein